MFEISKIDTQNLNSPLGQSDGSVGGDFLPINGTDYIELYVGNSKQAAHYYQTAFGFQDRKSVV